MLADKNSSAIVAVRDIQRARRFYETVLGLKIVDQSMGDVLTFATGSTRLNVYESKEAGSNRANAVAWDCGNDLDAIVAELRSRGATFEHYPQMGMPIEGDIHIAGEMRLVWLKDPDGNILHLLNA